MQDSNFVDSIIMLDTAEKLMKGIMSQDNELGDGGEHRKQTTESVISGS